jgi:hypothetical protein
MQCGFERLYLTGNNTVKETLLMKSREAVRGRNGGELVDCVDPCELQHVCL